MITLREYLMGRDATSPLTTELALNAASLLASVNFIRAKYDKVLLVSSGYRPGALNTAAKGAAKSPHLTCEAIDLSDPNGTLAKWLMANLKLLEQVGLYMEAPSHTPGWVHLQTRRPKSGNRIFLP